MTLTEVRRILEEIGVRPSKALGQNFLIDGNILRIVVEQADIRRDETVVEIGPGLGGLTAELCPRAGRVIAVERDRRLCAWLREQYPDLELIEGDAVKWLRSKPEIATPFKVVANLPYNISTAVLEGLVERAAKPRSMVLTLQREVAQRLAASPRHKEYGALTLFTQLYYHVTVAHIVSPRCFHPAPHVESAVVVLERRDPRIPLRAGAPFHEIVRSGFNQRRKMLRKLIAHFGGVDAAFARAGVAAAARAEELSLEQWITLANAVEAAPGAEAGAERERG